MIRPTTSPAGRAAVLLNYVLRPAGFTGHCNVRSSLNVAGEFRTSKKTPPVPGPERQHSPFFLGGTRRPDSKTRPPGPSCQTSGFCRMNPSHHGSDEQMFGAKQQVLRATMLNSTADVDQMDRLGSVKLPLRIADNDPDGHVRIADADNRIVCRMVIRDGQ